MNPAEETLFWVAVDEFLEAFARHQINLMREEAGLCTDPTSPDDPPNVTDQPEKP